MARAPALSRKENEALSPISRHPTELFCVSSTPAPCEPETRAAYSKPLLAGLACDYSLSSDAVFSRITLRVDSALRPSREFRKSKGFASPSG